jgi:hypothetical protein
LKFASEKYHVTYKDKPIRIMADFFKKLSPDKLINKRKVGENQTLKKSKMAGLTT